MCKREGAERGCKSEPQHGTNSSQEHQREVRIDDDSLDRGAGSGGSAAGITIIRDVVGVGGDLEDAAVETADVVVIDQQEVGGPVPPRGAVVDGTTGGPVSRDGVGLVEEREEGHEHADAGDIDVQVQVVVGHVHPVLARFAGLVRWPLRGAREVAVRGREGGFPHLAELVKQPGDGGLVGLVVEHDHGALLAEDHLAQRRPGVEGHRQRRRRVDVVDQARGDDGSGEVARVDEVVVADQDGDDVCAVLAEPVGHRGQVVLQRADVEEVAGRMA